MSNDKRIISGRRRRRRMSGVVAAGTPPSEDRRQVGELHVAYFVTALGLPRLLPPRRRCLRIPLFLPLTLASPFILLCVVVCLSVSL